MGLVPEFFMVVGIFVFLALSLLSILLDDDLPSLLPYLLQGAAAVGLGLLVMNLTLINRGIFSINPADPTRFGISVVYLGLAISIAAGLNVYLVIVRRKIGLSSILSGAVTVPTFMISTLLVFSFLGTGGELSLTSTTILTLVLSASIISLSILGLLPEAIKHFRNPSGGDVSLPQGPWSTPSTQGEDDWEKSPKRGSE